MIGHTCTWPEFFPRAGLLCAGQPDAAAWVDYAKAGYRTVISLRSASELVGRDEASEVRAAGMEFKQLPVDGLADMDFGHADALGEMLSTLESPVLVHCGSGNRVGALLALLEFRRGADSEAALSFGRRAGLTGAEAHVRAQLEAASV